MRAKFEGQMTRRWKEQARRGAMEGICTSGFRLGTSGTSFGLTGNPFPRFLAIPGAIGEGEGFLLGSLQDRGPGSSRAGEATEGSLMHTFLSSSPDPGSLQGRSSHRFLPSRIVPARLPPGNLGGPPPGSGVRILYSSPASPRSSKSRDSIRSRKGDSSSFASGLSRLSLSISSSRGFTPARSITSSST